MKHCLSRGACLFIKLALQFCFGGGLYYLMETVFRIVRDHPAPMPHVFFLGGGAFIIGLLMCRIPMPFKAKLVALPLLGVIVLTAYEYLFGWYFLTTQNLRIWDYNGCFAQYNRLICLQFSLCWGALMWLILALHCFFEHLLRKTPFADKNIFKR